MNSYVKIVALAASATVAMAGGALAGAPQPFFQAASPTPLPLVAFETDYAVSDVQQNSAGVSPVDTIVSIGVTGTGRKCNLQVAWYDWNGALAGLSGPFSIASGQTLEFTSSTNLGAPNDYQPYQMNVFRSPLANGTAPTFEGFAQILTDTTSCSSTKALRADAEYVTYTQTKAGTQTPVFAKVINISRPTGIVGY